MSAERRPHAPISGRIDIDEPRDQAIAAGPLRALHMDDVVFDRPLPFEVLVGPHAGAAQDPPRFAGGAAQGVGDDLRTRRRLRVLAEPVRDDQRLDRADGLVERVLAGERLFQEGARGIAQLVELAAGALRVVLAPKRRHRGGEICNRCARPRRGEELTLCDTQVRAVAIARDRLAPGGERGGERPRVFGGRDPRPVAAAIVSPAVEQSERTIAQLLEDVDSPGVGERTAHSAQVVKPFRILGARSALDPHAGEAALKDQRPLAVRAKRCHAFPADG